MSLPQLTDEQKANVKNFWYIPVIIVCLIFMYISFKYGTYHPDPQSKIVMEMVDKLLAEKQKNYETTINDLDAKLKEVEKKKKESDKTLVVYKKLLEKSEIKEKNIHPPKTMKEAKKRLKEMKYDVQ